MIDVNQLIDRLDTAFEEGVLAMDSRLARPEALRRARLASTHFEDLGHATHRC